MLLLLSTLLLATPAPLAAPPQDPELQRELEALVDLPTPEARRDRARELAKRKDFALDDWRLAMRRFGRFGAVRPGHDLHRVQLPVGDALEGTEISVYVPSQYDPTLPSPMLLLLHGAGGSGRSLIDLWQPFAEEAGMLLLAPTDQVGSGGYTFAERERLAALAALRWFRRRFNVDENRIHLSGISRGAHLGWDLATRYPDRWASFSPMIGGPSITVAEGRNNLRFIENLAPVPIRCLQGGQDDPRLLRNQDLAFERLRRAGAEDALLHRFPELGHSFKMEAVPWKDFLLDHEREAQAERIAHRCARLLEARSGWLRITRFDREVKEAFKPQVEAERWDAAEDETARLLLIQEQVDARTARLEVSWIAPGVFRAEGQGVRKFELLLTPERLGEDGRATIEFGGKTKKLKPKPSRQVLLEEFAERFDRRFLPVAIATVG